jgi:hypothetical protein
MKLKHSHAICMSSHMWDKAKDRPKTLTLKTTNIQGLCLKSHTVFKITTFLSSIGPKVSYITLVKTGPLPSQNIHTV